jgi:hypothetical protein
MNAVGTGGLALSARLPGILGAVPHVQKPDSGHTGIISITVRMRRTSWNAMKPRIQCALAQ